MNRQRDAYGEWFWQPSEDGAAVTGWAGEEEEIRVPAILGGLPVSEIGSRAFAEHGFGIRKIVLPGSVRRIRPRAFELCVSLKDLVLPEGAEELGEDFLSASAVEELAIPSTVRRIRRPEALTCSLSFHPDNPVYRTDGTGIYRKHTLAGIQPRADCTRYEITEGTEKIGKGAFENRPFLREIRIPSSVRCIDGGALCNERNPYSGNRGIRNVEVDPLNPVFFRRDSGLYERMGKEGSSGTKLLRWFGEEGEVVLPDDVREIGRDAFALCPVRVFRAGPSLRSIGENAFAGCPLVRAELGNDAYTVLFPQDNPYLLRDLLRGFGRMGRLYDFREYDRKLAEWYPDAGRVLMLASRLTRPMGLSPENKELFREMLGLHLAEAVRLCAEADAREALELLCGLELIGAAETDLAISVTSGAGRHEMTAILMAYRRRLFTGRSFDYSL